MENDNLKLWHSVEKTNPAYTKKAKVGGNNITSISPQFQIMNVTEKFGSYGKNWGFKNIELDYSLVNVPFKKDKTEGSYPNVKIIGKEDAYMGLVVFKAMFFYPDGEFPIINSISLFTNNEMSKIDDNFAKKVETDALTKAISKLGFNADIFMGKFDDVRYVEEMKQEFKSPEEKAKQEAAAKEQERLQEIANDIAKFTEVDKLGTYYKSLSESDQTLFKKQATDKKALLTPKQ